MPSSSDQAAAMELWLQERRDDALARFDQRIPALYAEHIGLPDFVHGWAAAGRTVPNSLFLTGPIGVGKTHTAWAATRAWLAACFTGEYRGNPAIQIHRSTSLFDELRPEGDDPRGVSLAAQRADLLFIDDLAAARVSPTGWTQERLYEIFDERYIQQRPVIITCDVLPNQLEPVVGPRVASRLAEMCRGGVHFMQGADRRKGGGK